MPVFEYKCSDCNEKFEVLHRSSLEQTDVSCPNCNSSNHKNFFLHSVHLFQETLHQVLIPVQQAAVEFLRLTTDVHQECAD
jgi:putative FmdB family regulatory protein